MYRRSSRLKNRVPVSTGSNQNLTSVSTTKNYVSKDSTQELVSSGAAQKSAPVIFTKELRETRKRVCKVKLNYGKNLKRNKPANQTEKNVEKTEAKNKQDVSLKRKKGVGSSSTKEDEDEAGNTPTRKVQRMGKEKGKEEYVPVKKDDNEEVAATEKLNHLLTSKDSFLTTVDLKELIPQWLEALPEEDRLELAPLLPQADCEVKEGRLTIREGFGNSSASHYLYEAAAQWQTVLALSGFEKENHKLEGQASANPFKDENYEDKWGDRVRRDQKAKTTSRGRPKKNK